MPLLTEKENRQILEFIRNAEFKDDRKKVPYWTLRYVCALISLFFFIVTPVLFLNGRGFLCAIPLLLGMCWLLVGIVLHVQWLRYKEIAALKSALYPRGETGHSGQP
ncbi:MAG: hypothetical protein WCV67_08060 [Victivallaceae bacterium]|jgi:hypothetical protein